ncbi:hypothetical protein IWZ00DRAFT_500797 [Phyllosticta capitalensis]
MPALLRIPPFLLLLSTKQTLSRRYRCRVCGEGFGHLRMTGEGKRKGMVGSTARVNAGALSLSLSLQRACDASASSCLR